MFNVVEQNVMEVTQWTMQQHVGMYSKEIL